MMMPFHPIFFFLKSNPFLLCLLCVILLFISRFVYLALPCDFIYIILTFIRFYASAALLLLLSPLPNIVLHIFYIYTFHIVYSIVGLVCCEKLSLAIMLNNMKIVKYTCNKFAVLKVSSVCSLLELVCLRRRRVHNPRATNIHTNKPGTKHGHRAHRHRHTKTFIEWWRNFFTSIVHSVRWSKRDCEQQSLKRKREREREKP